MTVLLIGQLRPPGKAQWLTDKLLAVYAWVFLVRAIFDRLK